MVVDPWTFTLALLTGTLAVPSLRWPPDRCRVIAAEDPDALPSGATDAQLVKYIVDSGSTTASDLAAALRVSRQAAHKRLHRMHEAGLVRRNGVAWQGAAGTHLLHAQPAGVEQI